MTAGTVRLAFVPTLVAVGALSVSTAAMAVGPLTASPGQGTYLLLESSPDPALFELMGPGTVVHWQVATHLLDAPRGSGRQVSLTAMDSDSRIAPYLRLSMHWCSVPWQVPAGTCAGESAQLLEPTGLAELPATSVALGDTAGHDDGEPYWLMVTAALDEATPTSVQEVDTTVRLQVVATGEDRLPATGAASLDALVLALSLTTLGFVLFLLARLAAGRQREAG